MFPLAGRICSPNGAYISDVLLHSTSEMVMQCSDNLDLKFLITDKEKEGRTL